MTGKTKLILITVELVDRVGVNGVFRFKTKTGGEVDLQIAESRFIERGVSADGFLGRFFAIPEGSTRADYEAAPLDVEVDIIVTRGVAYHWFLDKAPESTVDGITADGNVKIENQAVSHRIISRTFHFTFDSNAAALGFMKLIRQRFPWGGTVEWKIKNRELSTDVDYAGLGEDVASLIYGHLETNAAIFRDSWRICLASEI